VAHGLEVEALEQVERLQQHGPLVPGAGLQHLVAVEARAHRLLDAALVAGQVFVRHHAAGRARRVRDPARERALVKGVAPRLDRRLAVLGLQPGGLFRGQDRAQGARQLRLAEQLAHLGRAAVAVVDAHRVRIGLGVLALADHLRAQELVHREAVRQLERRGHHLLEAQRAELGERDRHRVEHRRHRRAERPVAVDLPLRGEQLGGGRARRRPLAIDHHRAAALRVVDQQRRLAAEAEMRNLDDGRRQHAGDAGVDRVAALLHHADARGDRVMPPGGDDAARAGDLGPQRVGPRARRGSGLLRDGRRHRQRRQDEDGERQDTSSEHAASGCGGQPSTRRQTYSKNA
jgi:hypothetical protein